MVASRSSVVQWLEQWQLKPNVLGSIRSGALPTLRLCLEFIPSRSILHSNHVVVKYIYSCKVPVPYNVGCGCMYSSEEQEQSQGKGNAQVEVDKVVELFN